MVININEKIKTVIESLAGPVIYLRAISLQEANYKLPKTVLASAVGINANASEIEFSPSEFSSFVIFNFPVDVWFLKKNESNDDTGEEIDSILDEMFPIGNEFFDKMQPLDDLGSIDTYTMTPVINFSDELLTGYRIQFEVPARRETFNC